MIEMESTLAINSLYMVFCTAVLPLIIIGISLFYAGITQRRSSFTMLIIPTLLAPFVIIDWFIWGYSLCYASASNRFIGNLKFVVLRHLKNATSAVYNTPRGEILSINHFMFNGIMKIVCVALTFPGCIAERGRIIPMLVFLFFWSCIIYNPVTYWFWNRNGWLSTQLDYVPVLDFAGGNCIHVVSGFTDLAYSYLLGPRNPKILYNYRSSNNSHIVIGTIFIICGWCGFIGGCDFKFSASAIIIFVNTLLCCSTSAVIWMFIDYYFSAIPLDGTSISNSSATEAFQASKASSSQDSHGQNATSVNNKSPNNLTVDIISRSRKFSMISFSSGAMAGLVVMTPAGGYTTEFWKPFVFGVVGAITGNLATRIKFFFNIDDAFDLFAIHGVAGIVGCILVGIFGNDSYDSAGGWVNGHWVQLGYQIAGSVVTAAYVFVMSLIILYVIDYIPGLHLRIDKHFNKRLMQEKREKSADIESQVSPTNIGTASASPTHVGVLEKAELLGSDWYEFSGEYSMDFMEFIKVIKPVDYLDDDDDDEMTALETNQEGMVSSHGHGSNYDMHSQVETQGLRKRE